MKYFLYLSILPLIFILPSCTDDSGLMNDPLPNDPMEAMYFPPVEGNVWDETSPQSLDWNVEKLIELNSFLEAKKTKGFMILKNGKIAMEEYYNNHNVNKDWTWYSAAKSLTSTLVGIGVMEGVLDLETTTSTYLGDNWSSAASDKEDLITVKNHLTMTTGFENPIGNIIRWTCTAPFCMNYEVDAGDRWAYHQGAFTLTQDIITNATGMNFQEYCKEKIQDKIGMNGAWGQLLDVRIFASTTRSMARFGLLALNEGKWDDKIIYPASYHNAMINTSQEHNQSYGYLWWLNGKEEFLGTQDQTVYDGPLIPNAPLDMFCALGAQDQKIYVIPSLDMVVVRCGEPAGSTAFASSSFDNELWGLLQEILP